MANSFELLIYKWEEQKVLDKIHVRDMPLKTLKCGMLFHIL